MAESKGVKLHGMWASPYSLRVELALKLKGVEYEYVNEDLPNKSPELLRYNPVHKKIPVLVHDGKPIAESLVIVEYIDEAWKDGYNILPTDPYERAMARFWVKFAEDKILPAIYGVYSKTGQEQLEAVEELKANLRIFGDALEGNKFFQGESIGFVEVAIGAMGYWIRMIEEINNISMVNEEELPVISAWFRDILALDVVKEILPPYDKLFEMNKKRKEQLSAGVKTE